MSFENKITALQEFRNKLPYGVLAYHINSFIFYSHPGSLEYQRKWRISIFEFMRSKYHIHPLFTTIDIVPFFYEASNWGRTHHHFKKYKGTVKIKINKNTNVFVKVLDENRNTIVIGGTAWGPPYWGYWLT